MRVNVQIRVGDKGFKTTRFALPF